VQNLRTLRQRIRSVQSTQKITRAMQMVAGAKLRRSQEELAAFKPYALRLEEIATRFLVNHPHLTHPLLESVQLDKATPLATRFSLPEGKTAPAGLVAVTSDTGLCGTYNERVITLVEGFLQENPSVKMVVVGKKGNRTLIRRGIPRVREILDWGGRLDPARMRDLLNWMESLYLGGQVSSWWIAYTQFISAVRWKPVVERFLPIERPFGEPPQGDTGGDKGTVLKGLSPSVVSLSPLGAVPYPEKVIMEPESPVLAAELLRRFSVARLRRFLLEAFTAEHSARMIAMKNATDNAAEMIDRLTLIRNKARQATITKELIEVVSGAEALR